MEQANTHKRLIREHLLNGGSITALEALWKSHSTLTPLGKQDCSLWP